MKATYTDPTGKLTLEIEAATQVDLFEQLANLGEVFGNMECVSKDGKRRSTNVRFQVREVDDNKYYELVCVEKGPLQYAKLQFGQHKKGGTLFPKSRTWMKWNPETKEEEEV